MIELTFVRHAPTEYNQAGVFMGILDVPLSEESKDIARSNTHLFGKYDYYFCSPLRRAKDTAYIIFPGQDIKFDPLLVEKNLGDFTGLLKKEAKQLYPEAFFKSGHLSPFYTPENGERFESVVSRAAQFLNKILDMNKDTELISVVVVSHNGLIRTIKMLIENTDPNEIFTYSEGYVSPIKYIYNGKWEKC